MPRKNDLKKKARIVKKTVLFYAEGMSDEIFLRYLRKIYARNNAIAIKIHKGNGSAADVLVTKAINFLGDFDRRVVVLDNDKPKQEMENARKKAKENNIILIENTPCLEATLLSVLNKGKDFSCKNSNWCKKKFEKEYIPKEKRSEMIEYEKKIPKKLLESSSLIKTIILLMQG